MKWILIVGLSALSAVGTMRQIMRKRASGNADVINFNQAKARILASRPRK